jgi:NTP pyrophosphatase (non-canonical NTP hydrolase)
MTDAINEFAAEAHRRAKAAGWWEPSIWINVPTKLCLIHSEISEGLEGYRKGLMDDKLPHREMLEVELADAMIRIGDLAGYLGYDLGGAIEEKMAFNLQREDHKIEVRMRTENGKKF